MGYFMKQYNFVYKTTNKINGKYYIGVHSTNDLDDGYLGSGNRIKAAVKKYGANNFARTIIKMWDTAEEAFAHERQIITEDVLNDNNCYNLRAGGHGGVCERTRIKVSEGRRRHFNTEGPSDAELSCYATRTGRYRAGEWTDAERRRHSDMKNIISQMKWYTNGVENTRAIEPPGDDWREGRTKSTSCLELKYVVLYQQCQSRQEFISKIQEVEPIGTWAASSLFYRIKQQLNEVALVAQQGKLL